MDRPNVATDHLVPLALAAQRLRQRPDTVRNWICVAKVDGVKLGRGKWGLPTRWFITEASLQRVLKDGVPDRRCRPRARDSRGRYLPTLRTNEKASTQAAG